MSGKGDRRRPTVIPKGELEIREELLYGPEENKPALLELLNNLVADRLAQELNKNLQKGDSSL